MFGYKAHLGVDQGSGLIRRQVPSPAKSCESEVADRLICGDEAAVYGDHAYDGKPRRSRFKAAGINVASAYAASAPASSKHDGWPLTH